MIDIEIVCIHGAGESQAVWAPLRDTLPEVRAVNLPGHGGDSQSGRRSISAYADWLRDTSVSSASVILAGHSMGGGIVLDLALREPRPAWLAGLVLVGTGGRLRVHPDLLALLDSDFDAAVEWIVERSIASKENEAIASLLRHDLRAAGREVLRDDLRACDAFDVLARLTAIDLPALVIVGEEDRMTPPKYARFLAAAIDGSRLRLVPNAGHMVTLEKPDDVRGAVHEFRVGVERSRGSLD